MEMNKGFWRRSQKCIELKILSGNYFRDHRFNPSLHSWWHRRPGEVCKSNVSPRGRARSRMRSSIPTCRLPAQCSVRYTRVSIQAATMLSLQDLASCNHFWPQLPHDSRLPQSSITKSIRWNNDCEVLCQSPSNFQLQRVNCISVIGKTSILN